MSDLINLPGSTDKYVLAGWAGDSCRGEKLQNTDNESFSFPNG